MGIRVTPRPYHTHPHKILLLNQLWWPPSINPNELREEDYCEFKFILEHTVSFRSGGEWRNKPGIPRAKCWKQTRHSELHCWML